MNIREAVKGYLRILGHALGKSIHERLDHTDHALDVVIEQNNRMARSQTALLQSSIHVVNALSRLQSELGAVRRDAAQIRARSERILDLSERLTGLSDDASRALAELAALRRDVNGLNALKATVEEEMVRQVCVETDDYAFTNPETGLIEHLYSFLPGGKALDIGAHAGDVAERMLAAGYEVYAFEPNPPVFARLKDRLAGRPRWQAFDCAIGSAETEAVLHLASDESATKRFGDATVFSSLYEHAMPEDLPFTGSVTVPVKTLAGLHEAGVLPEDIGLVKIDTEGYDLEVIRGMGGRRYPVVATEYWDDKIPFGGDRLLYTLTDMVGEMRQRGYSWHLVLYRLWGRNQTAFHANHERAVPESWGNIFFFQDYSLFSAAHDWCAAVLPRTYFKPAPGA